MTKDFIPYYRSSGDRDEQTQTDDAFRSFDQQRTKVEAAATLANGNLLNAVESLGVSGGRNWPEPALAEVIRRVDAGEADGIAVYSLDRFGRHLDALRVIERWVGEGKTFISATENFDTSTPTGKTALRMMMVIATWYWEQARERFAETQREAFAKGKWIGPTPLGYKRKAGVLYEDPTYGPLVRELFKVAAQDGIQAAREFMDDRCPVPPPNGKRKARTKRWSTSDIRKLLAHRVYKGEVMLHVDDSTKENGRDQHWREDAHVALATPEVWAAAQSKPRGRRANGEYPLSGIAVCGNCGAPMVGQLMRTRGRSYRRLRCSRIHGGSHGCASIDADKLEAYVRQEFKSSLKGGWKDALSVEGLDAARAEWDEAVAARGRFLSNTVQLRKSTDAQWSAALGAVEADVSAAEARYRELAAKATHSEAWPSASELDRPEQFSRALHAFSTVARVIVAPGRGTVAERVELRLAD